MKITEIREAKKGVAEANDLLKDGWELIQVIARDSYLVYVMGKRAGPPKVIGPEKGK